MQPPTERVLIAEEPGRGLRLEATPSPGEAFIDRLEESVFGSAGLRYRRLDIRERLDDRGGVVCIELWHERHLAGTYLLSPRDLVVHGEPTRGVYRSLLTIDRALQGRGLGRYLVRHALDWLAATAEQPLVTWGCIERDNERSRSLLASLGARRVAGLESRLVYRQWPRARVDVSRFDRADASSFTAALQLTENDCAIRDATIGGGNYFAVTGDDGIVAGARAIMTSVEMMPTGSRWDAFYAQLVRFLPPARRRFDPRNFRYLRLDDLVVRPGSETVWPDFLSTLMTIYDVHMAMFVLDPRAGLTRSLERAGLFGRFAAATRQHVDVMATGFGLRADLPGHDHPTPVALGPVDF